MKKRHKDEKAGKSRNASQGWDGKGPTFDSNFTIYLSTLYFLVVAEE